MSSCCCRPFTVEANGAFICPVSSTRGKAVDTQTVKALLTERALCRLNASSRHHFCPDPDCDVVLRWRRCDIPTNARVPVWWKEPCGGRTVSYCFGEDEDHIRAEIRGPVGRGRSRARAHHRRSLRVRSAQCARHVLSGRRDGCGHTRDTRGTVRGLRRDDVRRPWLNKKRCGSANCRHKAA